MSLNYLLLQLCTQQMYMKQSFSLWNKAAKWWIFKRDSLIYNFVYVCYNKISLNFSNLIYTYYMNTKKVHIRQTKLYYLVHQ